MKHCGTVRLETERLVLRRFTAEDAQAMYRNWASDGEVTRFLTWPAHAGPEVSKAVLEEWVRAYESESFYQWAIVPKEPETGPVGSISAVSVNDSISMVHVSYCIGRRWWHRGITSEALKAVIDFFFDRVGANRIESRHDPRNPRSLTQNFITGLARTGDGELVATSLFGFNIYNPVPDDFDRIGSKLATCSLLKGLAALRKYLHAGLSLVLSTSSIKRSENMM
ncbi:MAG: GNAT family N-acetyltransferase [Selenomonadaceae bacterium]|nr:GNAT family N-acetyltransferase [Selenomonadaceae bacterium]